MARGFCTCKRDFPGRPTFHPPTGAAWHYLCDKPVLPPVAEAIKAAEDQGGGVVEVPAGEYGPGWVEIVPTGTGWPVT